MSKYVRTKDGRIAEIKENMVVKGSDDATRLVYKKEPYICVLNGDDDILKQADTIEKLLDCAIEVTKDNKIIKWGYIESCKLYHQKESTIYGAIWILGENNEPILKSVTKLNDETWELI